jgi:hypothetical protein
MNTDFTGHNTPLNTTDTPVVKTKHHYKRKLLVTSALVGVLAFSTACTSASAGTEDQSPTSAVSVSTENTEKPTASPTPSASVSQDNPSPQGEAADPNEDPALTAMKDTRAISLENLKEDGIEPNGSILENKWGEYPQLRMTEEHSTAEFPEAFTGELPAGWSKEDVAAATNAGSNFVLQQVIDSPVNGDVSQKEAWLENNADVFHPDYREEILERIRVHNRHDVIVDNGVWQQLQPEYLENGYTYVHDGETPRVKDMNFRITGASAQDDNLFLIYEADYIMNGVSDKGIYEEPGKISGSIMMTKEGDATLISNVTAENWYEEPQLTYKFDESAPNEDDTPGPVEKL